MTIVVVCLLGHQLSDAAAKNNGKTRTWRIGRGPWKFTARGRGRGTGFIRVEVQSKISTRVQINIYSWDIGYRAVL